ncbi:hypothetical protein EAI_04518 [Harpegnathos saltator]|uniref:Uncharacterized protein n=1 Tax=Harpegnathos saltator TaxID=610380 RepID=E2BKX6_HARSA|nr:hypothetical protein EAI_04518 [Harpegnathos saltator]
MTYIGKENRGCHFVRVYLTGSLRIGPESLGFFFTLYNWAWLRAARLFLCLANVYSGESLLLLCTNCRALGYRRAVGFPKAVFSHISDSNYRSIHSTELEAAPIYPAGKEVASPLLRPPNEPPTKSPTNTWEKINSKL